jgi:hypothetical protein
LRLHKAMEDQVQAKATPAAAVKAPRQHAALCRTDGAKGAWLGPPGKNYSGAVR